MSPTLRTLIIIGGSIGILGLVLGVILDRPADRRRWRPVGLLAGVCWWQRLGMAMGALLILAGAGLVALGR